jgi:hypothetical protein
MTSASSAQGSAPPAARDIAGSVILGVLLLTAVIVRLPLVTALPFDFATMRQYHSAMIARAMYARLDPGAMTPERRTAAEDYVAQATIPEPIIVERIAAVGYVVAREERLWIPRALSALYWLVAALCLFGAGRAIAGPIGGLTAAAVHLFLPYGIDASVSFQPDALAVLLMSASLYGLTRLGTSRLAPGSESTALAIAVAFAALAILVRPMTGCFILPAMIVATWQRRSGAGTRGARLSPLMVMALAASVLPAVAYYLYFFVTDPVVHARVGATFAPGLFLEPGFWRGWARLAWLAFGPVVFVAALAGALFVARGRARAMLVSLWAGYALYGCLFNLHVSTHPYYQTLAVPMVALSLAPLAAGLASILRVSTLVPAGVAGLLLLSATWQGMWTRSPKADRVRAYEAVGRATAHSRRVIFLTDNWGVPLRYHADIGGRYWPTRFEIDMYRPLGAGGIPDITAEVRLRQFRDGIDAEYFAITDFDEFERQPDVRDLLDRVARLVERTDMYVVYELRR